MDKPEVKIEKFDFNALLEEFVTIQKQCLNDRAEINSKINLNPETDARSLYFKFSMQSLQTYQIGTALTPQIKTLDFVKASFEKGDPDKILNDLEIMHIEEMKAGIFLAMYVQFDVSIKLIWANCFSHTLGNFTDLEKICKRIIDETGLSKEYIELCKIILYTRNLMHYGGLRGRSDTTLTYKGKTYEFKEGEPTSFTNFPHILYLLGESVTFFKELFLSEPIVGCPEILHPNPKFFI